ncbi:MAG: 3-phosphoshikimate 1-carboxyvinyltransferase [Lawsonibacter sp.]|jgi:3-phosphoshikimate 1-carboxyvinyltransferase
MKDLMLYPSHLSGTVTPPPSKSLIHRYLLAAALAKGESRIENVTFSQDIQATLRCIQSLGACWEKEGDASLRIWGREEQETGKWKTLPRMDCGESGSTLRFFLPVALAVAGGGVFTGQGRLMQRPQEPYSDLFQKKGISWRQEGEQLTVEGKLEAGTYALPGDISSQFFTGLLYALSLVEGTSYLVATTPLESFDYLKLTVDVLKQSGIAVNWQEGEPATLKISGPGTFHLGDCFVEADWSQAAFWYAANFSGGAVDIQGLEANSTQGDKRIAGYYWTLARPGDVELDVSSCPDLVPPLSAMAVVRQGTTRLLHAARLRMKESDRLHTVAQAIQAMGGHVEEGADSLTFHGQKQLPGGGRVDSWNDHRIAMMTAVVASACCSPVTLTGWESVKKSYPNFWKDYQKLGGKMDGVIPG